MRAKTVVFLSLVLNVAMAFALWDVYLSARRGNAQALSAVLPPVWTNNTLRVAKTNVILNSHPFAWRNIETPDYDAYVFNLRSIGCPEPTLRDIIVADVDQVYARRRKEMSVTTNDMKWWLSEPDPDEMRATLEKEKALDEERRKLLTHLLGTNWEQVVEKERDPLVLAGPVLGALSPDQKQRVQDIVDRSRALVSDYVRQCESVGESPDPAELARLRDQTRQELSAQLSPEQLQEFLLRYSSTATQLRTELRGLEATPDEFRRLFVALEPIDRQIQAVSLDDDPAATAQLRRLEAQREAALRQTLGLDRYDAYRSLHDEAYRAALADAQEEGAPAQAGRSLYEINQAAAQEKDRIKRDSSLTPEQREQELKSVDQAQQAARAAMLGLAPPEPSPAAANPENAFQHQVGPHETLAGLSLYYRVPLSDLLRANPTMDPGLIQPGQTVKIPNPPPFPWQPGFVPQR